MTTSEKLVVLRGGVSVPVSAVVLLLDLEARGFSFSRPGPDTLRVSPPGQLTEADRVAIIQAKPHLLALVSYQPTDAGQPIKSEAGNPRQQNDAAHNCRTPVSD